MSRRKLREDKKCLNCETYVVGRYCHKCGQENIEPNPHFLYLFVTFFQNMFGYDSALWRTLKLLFLKPGKVAQDYLNGMRKSYVPPIRLYLFSSFLVFLFLAILPDPENPRKDFEGVDFSGVKVKTMKELDSLRLELKAERKIDSIHYEFAKAVIANPEKKDSLERAYSPVLGKIADFDIFGKTIISLERDEKGWYSDNKRYYGMRTVKDLEGIHYSLPKKDRLSWLEMRYIKKNLKLNEKGLYDTNMMSDRISGLIENGLPKFWFFFLPVFAWIVWLFHRPRNYYNAGVYTLYLFSFIFLLSLIFILLLGNSLWLLMNKTVENYLLWEKISGIVSIMFLVYFLIYFVVSYKRVYNKGWLKSIFNSIWITLIAFITLSVFAFIFSIILFFIL